MKRALQNGKRIQVLDAGEVRRWIHPSCSPPMEEQVAAVAWIARLLTQNDIDVIVACMAPDRNQRTTMRHRFYEEGIPFHEVWVDGGDIALDLERRFQYEHPDPPDARAEVIDNESWDKLARQVIAQLNL